MSRHEQALELQGRRDSVKLFAGKIVDRVQEELDKLGAQGWELVSVVQASTANHRFYLKKEA